MILEESVVGVGGKDVLYSICQAPREETQVLVPGFLEQEHTVCSRVPCAHEKTVPDVLSLGPGGGPTCHGILGTYILHCPSKTGSLTHNVIKLDCPAAALPRRAGMSSVDPEPYMRAGVSS